HGPDAAQALIICQRQQRLNIGRATTCPLPQQHQDVLQQGELIWIATDVVEEPRDQRLLHASAIDARRLLNCLATLISREARGMKLSMVDRFSEIGELRALAEKVRPHGNDDVDRAFSLVSAG